MADEGRVERVLLGTAILLPVLSFIAALQCHGMLLCSLLIARQRQQVAMLNAALEYNRALARLRHMQRRVVRRRRLRRKPGRTDHWWRRENEDYIGGIEVLVVLGPP